MNYTINNDLPCPPCYCMNNGINYTELGIFISGVILSIGAFCSIILGNLRKSNCSKIQISRCISCSRKNLEIEDV